MSFEARNILNALYLTGQIVQFSTQSNTNKVFLNSSLSAGILTFRGCTDETGGQPVSSVHRPVHFLKPSAWIHCRFPSHDFVHVLGLNKPAFWFSIFEDETLMSHHRSHIPPY
jgi:hypothetical protein